MGAGGATERQVVRRRHFGREFPPKRSWQRQCSPRCRQPRLLETPANQNRWLLRRVIQSRSTPIPPKSCRPSSILAHYPVSARSVPVIDGATVGEPLAVEWRFLHLPDHSPGLRFPVNIASGPADRNCFPEPALWVFDIVGLAVFIGVVGINAGPGFVTGPHHESEPALRGFPRRQRSSRTLLPEHKTSDSARSLRGNGNGGAAIQDEMGASCPHSGIRCRMR